MFKYCFHPVNLADTEKLLLLPELTIVAVFQTLFLAANAGDQPAKKNTGTNTKINTKTFLFIKIIITLIMSFKQILVVVILAILVGGSATFLIKNQSQISQKTAEVTSVSPTPTPVILSTWTDEAGFSFQYPEGITIDKHPDDTVNYANLTLTLSPANTINIIMADNTFKDLNAWVGQNSVIDTSLGGKAAKKVLKDGQTAVACIDSGVLVTITGQDVSTIVDSWTFIYPTPTVSKTTQTTTTTNDSGDVLEEE